MDKRTERNCELLKIEFPEGRLVGSLSILGQPFRKSVKGGNHWHLPVKCRCGKEFTVFVGHLRSGATISCGCVKSSKLGALRRKKPLPPATTALPKGSTCHQKLKRDGHLEEDLQTLPFVPPTNCKDFVLASVKSTPEHRRFVERYEWLGNAGYGVRWCFEARYQGVLGGVMMLAEPYMYKPGLGPDLECLIQRGACASWTPKNLGSMMVMFACRWMAQNTTKRVFYGYADPRAGEVGTIYQACNFMYLGESKKRLTFNAEGQVRSLQNLKRTARMVPWLAQQGIVLPPECFTEKGYLKWSVIDPEIKQMMRQHIKEASVGYTSVEMTHGRYAQVLGTKAEKRMIYPLVGEPKPYLKRL